MVPEHRYVVNQLEQRKADKNLRMEVRAITQEANLLARYLAQHGARTWNQLVIIEAPFGRIRELWFNDMGLGPLRNQFQEVWEEDLNEDGDAQEEIVMQMEDN